MSSSAIVFRFRENSDDIPYQFEQTTLAYAFFPEGESLNYASDIYINKAYQWGEIHTSSGYNLFKVIVHEIGHALGLEHSENIKDILYPAYQPDNNVVITQDTIDGIRKLYGDVVLEGSGDCVDYLSEVMFNSFADERTLLKLRESDLVYIANIFGIPATVKDLKRDTVRKILAYLKDEASKISSVKT